ncbi:hypothetical protein [Prevotella veroralis]|uniref:hypothetical protein n=1 Tax=Prevotella veroralis TaxID=28137 RepID=UPI0012B5EBAB|nr:hypothetical protein [Prevotella veroralis]
MTTEHHHQHSNHRAGFHNNGSSKAARRRHKFNQIMKFIGTIAAIGILYLVWWIYNN